MKKIKHFLALLMVIGMMLAVSPSSAQILNRLKNKADQAAVKMLDKNDPQPKSGSEKTSTQQTSPAGKPLDTIAAPADESTLKTYSKFDFVPGEKVIYAEDFSQDKIGEFPLHWNTGSNGVVMTLHNSTVKWLKMASGVYLSGSRSSSFGKDFTIEFDVFLNVVPKMGYYLPAISFGAYSSGKDDPADNKFLPVQHVVNSFQVKIDPHPKDNSAAALRSFEKGFETFGSNKRMPKYGSTIKNVAHYAIAVQGSRLRIWINEEKIFDVPRAVNTNNPINQIFFKTENSGGYNDDNYDYLLSNIKIASGYPDTRSKLVTEGKFVTTGILFDVNSDRIKHESYGTMKEIADVLKENTEIKVKIIGHTDADGNGASNLVLSKKRADAVKAFLVKEFAVGEDRLQTDGKGASQPIADNKTVSGKASNRRVEFIKL